MSIKIKCKVHSAGRQLVPVLATVEGQETKAMVDGFGVELVTDDNHSLTLSLFGNVMADAAQILKADGRVVLTIDTDEGK